MTLRERLQALKPWRGLDFELQRQERRYWCWAACAVSVARFYDQGGDWRQCAVASETTGRADCCESGACNFPHYVHRALETTGNLGERLPEPTELEELVEELKRGRPVVVRIAYPSSGHFVVVDGYRPLGIVRVRDPRDEVTREMSFQRLLRSYNGIGAWSHTYFTCHGDAHD